MKKAVIFDLDGTLVDSLDSIAYSMNKVLEKNNLPRVETGEYRYFVGDGVSELTKRVLYKVGDTKQRLYTKIVTEYLAVFEQYCMYQVHPYEGIVETLQQLKKRGISLAVLSNKPHERTRQVIQDLFGTTLFDVILGQTEEIARKPSPEGVFYIADQLGMSMEELLYVGDTNTDMQTGKSAGAETIGVLWGFRDREELEANHADRIIQRPQEILDILLEKKRIPYHD